MGLFENLLSARGVFAAICVTLASACSVVPTQETSEILEPAKPEKLARSDKTLADQKLQTALEKTLSGQSTRWQNPQSGASGSVTPLKTWKTSNGTYCRSFSEKIILASGKAMSRRGVACRSANAVWQSA